MKRMNKLFSLVLAVVMILALAVPALADDSARATYSVTINAYGKGHTFQAYQIFTGSLSYEEDTDSSDDDNNTILSNIQWGASIAANSNESIITALTNPNDTRLQRNGKNIFIGVTDAADVAAVLSNLGNNSTILDRFAEIIDGFLIAPTGGINGKTYWEASADADSNQVIITGLPAGYFLIKDKADSVDGDYDYYTRLILEVVDDSNIVQTKGSVPTVDKKVSASLTEGLGFTEYVDVNIGDTVYFELVATLPSTYADYENYKLTFVDTLSKGLTLVTEDPFYNRDTDGDKYDDMDVPVLVDGYVLGANNVRTQLHIGVDGIYTDVDGTKHEDESVGYFSQYGKDVSITWSPVMKDDDNDPETDKVATGETELRVEFADLKEKMVNLSGGDRIVLVYAAKLNEHAKVGTAEGEINTVYLEYSNNPQVKDDWGKTPPNDAKVYSFQLNVLKIDGATAGLEEKIYLAGAEFVLYREVLVSDGALGGAHNVKEYAKVDANGTLVEWVRPAVDETLADPENSKPYDPNKVASEILNYDGDDGRFKLTTGSDGKISVKGLDQGTYMIVETKAPNNYNNLDSALPIAIVATYTGETQSLVVRLDGNLGDADLSTGIGTVTITNNKGNTLPTTGGVGTTMFYVFGGILVCGAAVLLITKKRMSY